MNEFAQKGYDNASTNQIVRDAQISKGILFHYFKKYKELFLFLYDFATKTLLEDYFKKLDNTSRDIFLRLKQIALYKLEIMSRFPDIIRFAMVAQLEEADEVRQEMQERKSRLALEAYSKVYENVDVSLFEDGIDPKKAIEIISWTLEGYALRVQVKIKQIKDNRQELEKLMAGIDPYLEILKKSFYK